MRGEELGGGGDVLVGPALLTREDLVLPLRDVELVEPADDLDLIAILVSNLGAKSVNDGLFGKKIIWEQQFGFVIQFFENIWQQNVIEPADSENEVTINFALRIGGRNTAIQQIIESFWIGVGLEILRQSSTAHELQEFRLRLRCAGRRENARSERMPAASVHKSERCEAIEPCVGNALDQPGTI